MILYNFYYIIRAVTKNFTIFTYCIFFLSFFKSPELNTKLKWKLTRSLEMVIKNEQLSSSL